MQDIKFGFKCTHGDPSLFVYLHGSDVIYLLLYVDDMLLTGNNEQLIQRLMVTLNGMFRMKDMGPVHYFLGIQVKTYDEGLFLCQEKYTKDLLEIAGMAGCDETLTPLPLQLDRVVGQDKLFDQPTYFRSLAGKLQYLTLTRPDIQFAVNYVCQMMHALTVADFTNLRRILRYLKGTSHLGLTINAKTGFLLYGFSDSDWAGCRETRRSTGGLCTFLGSNIISWSAKRHPTVSRSSTEAEYRTLSITATELKWLASLLGEMGISLPDTPQLFCDNLSAVYLTVNPVLHTRSKHFDTDFNYVRERVALGALVVNQIPAAQQLADIFTKSLAQVPFCRLRDKLGVVAPPTTSLRGCLSLKTQTAHQSQPIKSTVPSSNGSKHTTHVTPKHCLCTALPAKEAIISNRFEPLMGCAVTC